ncbi:MAG: DUF47 domain-containing protein [Kineosporiaceae bacterium]
MTRHWFLPDTPDVLATLRRQADITVAGLSAFAAWAHGDTEAEHVVRSNEHAADGVRRELARQLRAAFSTPVPQEDVFALSELLDAVLNRAKDVVREAELLDLRPDTSVATMADAAADGVRYLAQGLAGLTAPDETATAAADAAIAAERRMEKTYRAAMRDVLADPDVRGVVARREIYRRVLEVGERVEAVADRIWYAVVKEG